APRVRSPHYATPRNRSGGRGAPPARRHARVRRARRPVSRRRGVRARGSSAIGRASMHQLGDRRRPPVVAAILIAAVGFATASACAGSPSRAERLEVSRVYLAGGIAGAPAALYATVDNHTGAADTLVALTVSVADRAELHTQMRHGEGMGATVMME